MSDWDSDYSSLDDVEATKRCPHERFNRSSNTFGAGAPLQVVIDASAECIECELLLQAVSNFKPGWIEENTDSKCFIGLTKRKTYTVQLYHGSYDGDPVATFQMVHRSKGRYC